MIVPEKITNYNLDNKGLEEYALFCLMVFNKNANQTAVKLESFLNWCQKSDVGYFDSIKRTRSRVKCSYRDMVEKFRFGNTTVKSDGLQSLISAGLNLRTCSPEELEEIPGFGMKTSRFFILHTRPDAQVACLDTHILEWLSYYTSYDVKKSPSKNKYLELEHVFLKIADSMNSTPADLDLKIWNKQRGSDEKPLVANIQKKKE